MQINVIPKGWRKWTPEELAYVKAHMHHTANEIAQVLSRTKDSVRCQLERLKGERI